MKLFGRYARPIAYRYKDLLEAKGISIKIDDTLSDFKKEKFMANNYKHVDIWIEENDFDQAFMLIREFESQANQRVEEMAKEFRPKLLLIVTAIVLLFITFIIVFIKD